MTKILMFLLRLTLGCVAAFMILVLVAITALQFDSVRHRLLEFVYTKVQQETGWTVEIASADEITSYQWKLHQISLRHPDHPQIRMKSLDISIIPMQLFLGRIAINEIVACEVQVDNYPAANVSGNAMVNLFQNPLRPVPRVQGMLQAKVFEVPSALRSWLGDNVVATASFSYHADQFTLHNFNMTTPLLVSQGYCAVYTDSQKIDSHFKATLNSLPASELPVEVSGQLNIDAEISGAISTPEIHLALSGDALTIQQHPVKALAANLNGQWHDESLECTTKVQCQIKSTPFDASYKLIWSKNKPLQLQDIRAFLPNATLHGQLNVDLLENAQVRGRIIGHFSDMTPWSTFLGVPVKGMVHVVALFSDAFSLDAKIRGLHVADDFHAEHVSLKVDLDDLWNSSHGELKVNAAGVTSGSLSLARGSFTAQQIDNGAGPGWGFTVSGQGHLLGPLNIEATGQLLSEADLAQHRLSIKKLSGTYREESFALESPLDITQSPNRTELSPCRLRIGRGVIEGHGSADTERFTATLLMRDLSLDLLTSSLGDSAVHGSLSGNAAFSGVLDNPEMHLKLNTTPLALNSPLTQQLSSVQTTMTVDIKDQMLSCFGTFAGLTRRPVEVRAQLPIEWTMSRSEAMKFGLKQDQPIDVKISGGGEISPFLEALSPGTTPLTGDTDIALEVKGTWQQPQIDGSLVLRNGTFESLDTGCVLKNIFARCEAHENALVLSDCHADDGENGQVTGGGDLRWDTKLGAVFDLGFNLTNVVILRRDFIKGAGSGNVHFKGQGAKSMLTGKITTTSLDVTLPEDSPASITDLDVTFVNDPDEIPGTAAVAAKKKEDDHPIDFDVAIHVADNASIKGNDLQSQWRGDLKLLGNSDNVELHGEVKLVRGEFRVNGKPFVLGKGQILFAGDIEKSTTVSVSATQEISAGNIEAVLRGPIRAPTLALRSNPPMAQREILSWLLFGHGLSEDSPFESSQLNDLALNLASTQKKSKSSKTSMLNKLQRFGIDTINIDSGGEGFENNVSLNIGKYLTQRLYVSVNKGLTTEGGKVSVEADVVRNVKLKAEVADDAAAKMLLMWRHDY